MKISVVTIVRNDCTHIEIASNPVSIKIFSPSGKPVQEIISISRNGEKTVVKGRLLDEEAIYGGGERFDSLNKRGRSFTLFTEDGWNRADTTYIAIPFFTTTRGGGFLVNAYEPMTADFGKCSANEWAIELDGTHSDIFIFDEPTRGIDVAAKVEIYHLMNQLKQQGISVIFVSSEMPEVLGIADRIIVMCDGRVTGELDIQDATQEKILELATRFENKLDA